MSIDLEAVTGTGANRRSRRVAAGGGFAETTIGCCAVSRVARKHPPNDQPLRGPGEGGQELM